MYAPRYGHSRPSRCIRPPGFSPASVTLVASRVRSRLEDVYDRVSEDQVN